LRVYSAGRFRDVQVTAGKASDVMRLGGRFRVGMPGMDGMMQFDGPGTMMFGPDLQVMRERMPMIRKRIEPLLRGRLNGLPNRIQLRAMPRIRTMAPAPDSFTLDDMPEFDEPFILDDFEPFYFEDKIEQVSPEVIRELAAITARDARVAIEQLAAAGIV
jgi:hypothetical protein